MLELCEGILQLPQPGPQKRNHHRVLDLWRDLKPMIKRLCPGEGEEELKVVDRLVKELAKIDPDSIHTRYPKTNKGAQTMKGMPPFNVVNVHEAMCGMAGFFDGVEGTIEAAEEARQESRREDHY